MGTGDMTDEERARLYKFEKIKETVVAVVKDMSPDDANIFYLGYILGIGAVPCQLCPAYAYCQSVTDAKKVSYGNCEEVIPLFIEDQNAKVKRGISEDRPNES